MANIRVVRTKIISNTKIEITFTTNLDSGIDISNIFIKSLTGSVRNPDITSVSISNNLMTINVRTIISGAYYQIILKEL